MYFEMNVMPIAGRLPKRIWSWKDRMGIHLMMYLFKHAISIRYWR